MKHTEGEWVVKPNPSDSKKYGIWSQHPTRGTILIAMAHMDFMTEEEFKSNAKLIAAAPELLKQLKMALWILEQNGITQGQDQIRNAIRLGIEVEKY